MATANIPQSAPKLRRSNDKVLAGVCSGLAAYFGVDAVVVRILGVLLLFVSFGWLALVYVLLWFAMPPALPSDDPINIEVDQIPRGGSPVPSYTMSWRVIAFIVAGVLIVCLGMAAVMDAVIVNAQWWQFWPLLLFAAGLVLMIVPVRKKWRADALAAGIALMGAGALCLMCSLGIMSWETVILAIRQMWGLLVLAAALFAFGHLRGNGAVVFGAGVVLFAICALAVVLCGTPGAADSLVLKAPVLGGSEFVMQVWPG